MPPEQFRALAPLAHPLQGVLQQLDGTVDGLLRHIGRLPVPLDLQHCHLQTESRASDPGIADCMGDWLKETTAKHEITTAKLFVGT